MQISEETAKNILITAVEGGINYWARVTAYKPDKCMAKIVEFGDGDGNVKHDLNQAVIQEGVNKISTLKSKELSLHHSYIGRILGVFAADEEDMDIDAEEADYIVQIALFGKVIYG